jgi:hypothetical protein
MFATRDVSCGEIVCEEDPLAFDEMGGESRALLYTAVWRLTAQATRTPELFSWLSSGELQPLPHAALQWDGRDESALRHVSTAYGRSRNDVYKTYATVASVNLKCLDGSAAIYRTMSYLNHACEPNCHVIPATSGGLPARLRAVRGIAEGEEATISFIAPSSDDAQCANAALARLLVKEMYGFECRRPVHPHSSQ